MSASGPPQPDSATTSSEPTSLPELLRRNLSSIAGLAAGVFALLWLGAEVTIARLERESASLKGQAGNAFAPMQAQATQRPTPAPQLALPSPGPRRMTDEQHEAMLRILYTDATDKRAWLVKSAQDAEAASYAESLAGVFRAAGWSVEVSPWSAGTLKAGVRLFVGPDEPTPAVELVNRALEAAGAAPQQFTGYRAYREERMRTDPSAGGIDLAPNQDFVIVVGRAE